MARILFLHDSSAGPFDDMTEHPERHGHEVVGLPRLPYPRYARRSWWWIVAHIRPEVVPRGGQGVPAVIRRLPSGHGRRLQHGRSDGYEPGHLGHAPGACRRGLEGQTGKFNVEKVRSEIFG